MTACERRQQNKSGITIIDLGSSCFETERLYTYIQSRFYRAPEVVLGLPYGRPIDMWSFGCILCELLTGYPIFPGENEVEQFLCIAEVLGPPPPRMVDECTRKKNFFDAVGAPKVVANSRGKRRAPGSKDLAAALRCSDRLFLSFIASILRWDPAARATPEAALAHPWIADVKKEALRPPAGAGASASAAEGGATDAGGGDPKIATISTRRRIQQPCARTRGGVCASLYD